MQVPLKITMRHIPQSDALETRIRQRAAKLEEFHPNITSCQVTIEELRRHHRQGFWFNVRIEVRVPGHDIVVNRDHGEDAHVAVRDAFDAVTRRLEDVARMRRGDVKTHAAEPQGAVARNVSRARPAPGQATGAPNDDYDDALPGSLLVEDGGPRGAPEAEGAVDDWPTVDREHEDVIAEPAGMGGRHRR